MEIDERGAGRVGPQGTGNARCGSGAEKGMTGIFRGISRCAKGGGSNQVIGLVRDSQALAPPEGDMSDWGLTGAGMGLVCTQVKS